MQASERLLVQQQREVPLSESSQRSHSGVRGYP
jgi:hypothetical protein